MAERLIHVPAGEVGIRYVCQCGAAVEQAPVVPPRDRPAGGLNCPACREKLREPVIDGNIVDDLATLVWLLGRLKNRQGWPKVELVIREQ
jgi:hypothetical protein